jgi:NAD(P)-dependent dehydrogenase (short-subunit alcohol dehydrogenase family)
VELGLSGSVVVVFGAARGIGAAIARAFAAEAAHVAAVDRDPAVLALADELAHVWGETTRGGGPRAKERLFFQALRGPGLRTTPIV